MKTLTKHLWFQTKKRIEQINITPQVEKIVAKVGVKEGLCLVNAITSPPPSTSTTRNLALFMTFKNGSENWWTPKRASGTTSPEKITPTRI